MGSVEEDGLRHPDRPDIHGYTHDDGRYRYRHEWPEMVPERVVYGAGTKRFRDRPNLVRLVVGR